MELSEELDYLEIEYVCHHVVPKLNFTLGCKLGPGLTKLPTLRITVSTMHHYRADTLCSACMIYDKCLLE